MPAVIFFAGFDSGFEDVLFGRQGAGFVLGEGARGNVSLVEIEREAFVVLRLLLDVDEAGGCVSGVAGGGVAEDEEQAAVFCDCVEAVGLAVELEFGVAGAGFLRRFADDVRDRRATSAGCPVAPISSRLRSREEVLAIEPDRG